MFTSAVLLLLASCSPPPAAFPPDFNKIYAQKVTLALAYELCELHPSRDSSTPGALAAAEWIKEKIGKNQNFDDIFITEWSEKRHFEKKRASIHPPRIDTFIDNTPTGSLTFHNVLAELPAENSGAPWIVLISHYDTKSGIPNFVGANDGASSTALLLSLHRLFAPRNNPFNFLFAFLDGEECQIAYAHNDGLHGSKRLARQLKDEGRNVRAVIVLDMIGDADLHIAIPANCTPDLRARALVAASKVGTRDYFSLSRGAIIDDHVPFYELGFPALNFIDFDYGPNNSYWHTSEDTPDKLSANSFLVVAKTLLQLIADLNVATASSR